MFIKVRRWPSHYLLQQHQSLLHFVMAYRLLSDGLQELIFDWQKMLIILASLSLIFGNIIAIAQSNIKRMLAYSTISHVGFILFGLLSGHNEGYAAALFYTVVYVLMAAGAFGVLLILSGKDKEVELLADLKGLSRSNPWFALLMLLNYVFNGWCAFNSWILCQIICTTKLNCRWNDLACTTGDNNVYRWCLLLPACS